MSCIYKASTSQSADPDEGRGECLDTSTVTHSYSCFSPSRWTWHAGIRWIQQPKHSRSNLTYLSICSIYPISHNCLATVLLATSHLATVFFNTFYLASFLPSFSLASFSLASYLLSRYTVLLASVLPSFSLASFSLASYLLSRYRPSL